MTKKVKIQEMVLQDEEEYVNTGPPLWKSTRFVIAVIGFFGMANGYAQRVNFSVALVCMLNHTAVNEQAAAAAGPVSSAISQNASAAASCDSPWATGNNPDSVEKEMGSFVWSKSEQGLLLSSFFWGYLFTQIPGGVLSERFGAKHIYLWTMLLAGICTLLVPLAANVHLIFLITLRILIGMGQGVMFPATQAIWARWAPPMERSTLSGFSFAGAQIGNVIAFPLAGILCGTAGWESVFYVFGSLGVVWCVAWFFFVGNTPSEHKRISPEERSYIIGSLRGQIEQGTARDAIKIPWMSIFKSAPVWAIVVSHTSADFGVYLVLTTLPTYMKEALNFDIQSNGLFSAIPYMAYFICVNIAGLTSDFVRKRGYLSTTNVRKICMFIALFGQACFLVATGYCVCGQELLSVALITIAQGISAFQYGGAVPNAVDIAPQFAGTVFGIANMSATVSGIVAPSVAALLTAGGTREEWRSVFWVAFGVLTFGAIFFAIFASGDIQPWAIPSEKSQIQLVPLNSSKSLQTNAASKLEDDGENGAADGEEKRKKNGAADSVTFT